MDFHWWNLPKHFLILKFFQGAYLHVEEHLTRSNIGTESCVPNSTKQTLLMQMDGWIGPDLIIVDDFNATSSAYWSSRFLSKNYHNALLMT